MQKVDVLTPQFPVVNEIVCQLHRTRPKQRHQRNDVRKALGFDFFHQILHTP